MKRVIVAAILGGIVMYIWNFIGHDLLPLGQAGMSQFPKEQNLRNAIAENLTQAGIYHFPGWQVGANATRQEKRDAIQRAIREAANGPSGLLIYHPSRTFSFGRLLGIELLTELVEAFVVVFLLAQTVVNTFESRVSFVLLVGIVAAIATNVPYWNWYGFPTTYTAAYMSLQIIGFLCLGIVAALVLRKPATA